MNGMPVEDRDKELVQKFRSVVNRKEQGKKSRTAVKVSAIVAAGLAVIFFAAGRLNHPGMDVSRPALSTDPAPPSASTPPEATAATGSALPEKTGDTIPLKKRRYPAPRGSTASRNIRIAEIVTCKQVKARRYVSPRTVFSLKKDAHPGVWVWMELEADRKAIPCTLRHAYYLEGRKYAEVPLAIRHSSMRTWSHLSLNRSMHVGQWRVAVITEQGETLSQIEFSVTP